MNITPWVPPTTASASTHSAKCMRPVGCDRAPLSSKIRVATASVRAPPTSPHARTILFQPAASTLIVPLWVCVANASYAAMSSASVYASPGTSHGFDSGAWTGSALAASAAAFAAASAAAAAAAASAASAALASASALSLFFLLSHGFRTGALASATAAAFFAASFRAFSAVS